MAMHEALRLSPLFRALGNRECEEVAALLVERVFPAGSEFAEAGFLLIAAGRASLTVDGNPVRSLGPGDHIGAAALVGLPRGALVTALTDMRCLAMPWPVFRQLLDANPRIAGELLIAMGTQPAPSSGAEGDERRRGSARTRRRATSTASHLSTASDEAATALLPAFVVGTLGASPLALGLIEGLANAADGVARLGGGALSENPRRRPLISMVAFTLTALLNGLVAVATTSPQVGVLRAGASGARGLRSPQRYAAVPERAGTNGYGKEFGRERAIHHLVSVAGPLLAFTILALADVRSALVATLVPGLLAVTIGTWVIRRTPPPPDVVSPPPRLRVRAVFQGPLGRFMTGITLFELANFAAVLLILRTTKLLEQRDVPFGASAMAVLLYLLWRLAASATTYLSGHLLDHRRPVVVMRAGVITLLISYAGFALLPGTVLGLAMCFVLAGAASGAVDVAEHVGVAQVAPEPLRWSAFGSLSAVRSFGRLTATIGATAVWTFLGAEFGLLLAAPLMLAALAVMSSRHSGRRRQKRGGSAEGPTTCG
ncbi:MFS transporter [Kribbella sp. CA-294648]|uniref:MFS transporter n=1 Tax=Kribbella sp. CA-294648 TaxID=3239948 RepID=UPI003D8D7924